MNLYVLGFQDIDKSKLMIVGGKGANLGELSKIEGIRVPEGFCVTTEAYKRILEQTPLLSKLLDQLSLLHVDDREEIAAISGKIREMIENTVIPHEIAGEIESLFLKLGERDAYAVRSSATAEDLPTASFAGQQDTYLNIKGYQSILLHISKCWASLFTDRAVIYRIQNGFDHRKVFLSIVIQKMVFPQASGIMFTADPVTSNRKVLSIDAGFGLGEALVSGLVNADIYKVRDGEILDKKVSAKKLAIYALEEGGTVEKELPAQQQTVQALTDEQILRLALAGRKIETYFFCPQDIEWCLSGNTFYIVQSRPITTLYPLPEIHDEEMHVYMSVGHQQMMTEAIKPFGLSFFKFLADNAPMLQAGGRLYFDLTHDLASSMGRNIVLRTLGSNDPLSASALRNLTSRKNFVRQLTHGERFIRMGTEYFSWSLPMKCIKLYNKSSPDIVRDLMEQNEAAVRQLEKNIAKVSGNDLFTFILDSYTELKHTMYHPQGIAVIMVGMYAASWLNKHMEKWLGVKSAADILAQSVDNNITSEMGLALLDVADVVRGYPQVIAYFQHAKDRTFFDDLAGLEGGEAVSKSIQAYLKKYGMRCSGEIDITKSRWEEQPTGLVPMILSNIKNFEPNAHSAKFEKGLLEADRKKQELINRLERMSGGRRKAKKTKKMIDILRNLIGYREYPKYTLIQRYGIFKKALLKEAEKLVQAGIFHEKEDMYYLTFEEFRDTVKTNHLDYGIVNDRKEKYTVYDKLVPPRIMTSDGEVVAGEYAAENIPQGALPGIPVSSGVIEGRARVVLKQEDAVITEGDILVTAFTDPSWTPLFVSVKGLVAEVGGMMSHGAVITREYGLPAVVGVENATKLIRDGQRIRVNGTQGYVEILE